MEIIQAVILGIVQGFTEFLPISSSAHLYLIPYLFNWQYQGLEFDVALHWGTLVGVLAVFWRDYLRYLLGFLKIFSRKRDLEDLNQRMAWYLGVGSIPAALVGFLLRDIAESVLRNPLISAVMLVVFGLFLLWADRTRPRDASLEHLDTGQAFLIGVGQAMALIPGVSRSGATITIGRLLNLPREEAARFAFLLSGPAIFGAGLVAFPGLTGVSAALMAGFMAAAVSSFIAIHLLLRYLTTRGFDIFVWYRIALAAVILITVASRS